METRRAALQVAIKKVRKALPIIPPNKLETRLIIKQRTTIIISPCHHLKIVLAHIKGLKPTPIRFN